MAGEQGFADFASVYVQTVNWSRRLSRELPFYSRLFDRSSVRHVSDVGCGPGRHAAAFAGWGLTVTAVDADPGMLVLAREHAREKNVSIDFVHADFFTLGEKVHGPFDVVVCVGNSFPALEGSNQRLPVLKTFARLLRPDGLLVLHVLNYDRVHEDLDAGGPVQVITSPDGRFRFMKSFQRSGSHLDLCIEFKEIDGPGGRFIRRLYPVSERQLRLEVESAGMSVADIYGDYAFAPFDLRSSRDLILVGHRRHGSANA